MSSNSNAPGAATGDTARFLCCDRVRIANPDATDENTDNEIIYTNSHILEFRDKKGTDLPLVSLQDIDRTTIMYGVLIVVDLTQPSQASYFGITVDADKKLKHKVLPENFVALDALEVMDCLNRRDLQRSQHTISAGCGKCYKSFTLSFCHHIYDASTFGAHGLDPRALKPVMTTGGDWFKECSKNCVRGKPKMKYEAQFRKEENGEWHGECEMCDPQPA